LMPKKLEFENALSAINKIVKSRFLEFTYCFYKN
jgi:hypothetical protein